MQICARSGRRWLFRPQSIDNASRSATRVAHTQEIKEMIVPSNSAEGLPWLRFAVTSSIEIWGPRSLSIGERKSDLIDSDTRIPFWPLNENSEDGRRRSTFKRTRTHALNQQVGLTQRSIQFTGAGGEGRKQPLIRIYSFRRVGWDIWFL